MSLKYYIEPYVSLKFSKNQALRGMLVRGPGRLYLAKLYSAKSECAVQESARTFPAKSTSDKPHSSGIC